MPTPPRTLFADAFYWIALAFPRDAHHANVSSFSRTLGAVRVLTTDDVLSEVLTHFCCYGVYWRKKSRPDKEYSLIDCRSMVALRAAGVSEVLSNDHHFRQEGFTILFP